MFQVCFSKLYSNWKQAQPTLSSDTKNATPVQRMRLQVKGRYGRAVGTWRVFLLLLLLLLLLFFHLSKRKNPCNLFPRQHKRWENKKCTSASLQESSANTDSCFPTEDASTTAFHLHCKRKQQPAPMNRGGRQGPEGPSDCWSWDKWLTDQISMSLPGLSLCWSDRL